MAGFRNGTIVLDSPRAVFYPGQVISGKLEIVLDQPLTVSVIYVKFLGEAIVSWTEEESEEVNGVKRYKTIEYTGREMYFKGSELLFGSYGNITNMNPGKYSYPFSYRIPLKAPSSFKGSRGKVVYSVNGHVEFQGQKCFQNDIVKYFDLVAPFDLNKGNECVREPIEMEFEELVGCGCFSSNPVNVQLRVPVSAYCPGQTIPMEVKVNNRSSVEISRMIFELLTRQRYVTQRPVSEYVEPEEVMASVKKGSIMSGTKRNFIIELTVPDFIAPNLEDCSIIDVGYFLRITIKFSGCNEDCQDEAEICLGLIPLDETTDGTYVHPMAHSLPVDPIPSPEVNVQSKDENARQEAVLNAALVPGTIGFVTNNHQTSSSTNYNIGFHMPDHQNPPSYNPQFNQSPTHGMAIPMEDMKTSHNAPTSYPGYPNPTLVPPNTYPSGNIHVPMRSTTPEPTAPPM